MRLGVSALALLAACGRFGFDATSDGGGAGSDGSNIVIDALAPDGVAASSCTATRVADVMLTPPVENIIVAKTTGGYAVGFITGASSFLGGVFVNDSFEPNTDAPHRTSPVPGETWTYVHASLFWTGSVLVGATSVVETGECFKKIIPTTMMLYTYADNGQQCRNGEPSVAKADTTVISTWYVGSEHWYVTLLDDGMPQNPEISGGVVVGTITDTAVASGVTAVVASTLSGGSCEIRQLPSGMGQSLSADPCDEVDIRNAGVEDEWLVTYRNLTNVSVRSLSYAGASMPLTISAATDIGVGAEPKLFLGNGGWLAAVNVSDALVIRDIDPVANVAITGLPPTPMSGFEVAEDAVFAAYGQDLYAITCK